MRKIWKYEIPEMGIIIRVPKGSEFMHIDSQYNTVCIWVATTISDKDELWDIKLKVTGASVNEEDGDYMGTVLLDSGSFVVHAFCKVKE